MCAEAGAVGCPWAPWDRLVGTEVRLAFRVWGAPMCWDTQVPTLLPGERPAGLSGPCRPRRRERKLQQCQRAHVHVGHARLPAVSTAAGRVARGRRPGGALSRPSCVRRKYAVISSSEQRQSYKNDFNAEYSEYRDLHSRIEQITRRFTQLDAQLRQLSQGSPEYEVRGSAPRHALPPRGAQAAGLGCGDSAEPHKPGAAGGPQGRGPGRNPGLCKSGCAGGAGQRGGHGACGQPGWGLHRGRGRVVHRALGMAGASQGLELLVPLLSSLLRPVATVLRPGTVDRRSRVRRHGGTVSGWVCLHRPRVGRFCRNTEKSKR